MSLGSGSHLVAGNTIHGGLSRLVIVGGEAELTDCVIGGVSGRGFAIGAASGPTLSRNRSCGDGENLWVDDGATPDIDESNEICEDAPAE